MELLNPHVNQIIYSAIAFFVLLAILGKLAFPPLVGILQKRSDTIRESLEAAEKTQEEAGKMLDEYKQQIANAREESQKIIEQGRKFGESMKEEIAQKARQESEQALARAAAEVNREKERALAEIQSSIADLTIGAASRVIGASLDKKGHEKLIEDYLSEVGSLSEN